jgi:hypothetical protein
MYTSKVATKNGSKHGVACGEGIGLAEFVASMPALSAIISQIIFLVVVPLLSCQVRKGGIVGLVKLCPTCQRLSLDSTCSFGDIS